MQIKDSKGNELVEVIKVDEHTAMEQYHPVTHCLAVVMVGSEYLLGWNRWRKHWEIFGGCIEEALKENVWKRLVLLICSLSILD